VRQDMAVIFRVYRQVMELGQLPRRWDIAFIRKFMFAFGLVSSVFDYLTFGVLLLVLHATPEQFRTGCFMESVVSAAIIVLVIRSRRPFYKSRPGNQPLVATLAVVMAALIIPFMPLGSSLPAPVLSPDPRLDHDPVYIHGGSGKEGVLSADESLKLLRC